MKNVNKVFLLGNVSRDPEIKQTASGKKVAIFGIATNRDWANTDGSKSSLTEFHNCIAWGRLADLCEMYLKKGQLVHGEGYLKTRSWEDENGKRHFRTEVVLVEVIILEKFSKRDGDENSSNQSSNSQEYDHGPITDDDISEDSNIDEPLFEEEK